MQTKARLLRFSIAFALRSVRLNWRRMGLSEDERFKIADDTITEMRRYDQWKELDDEVEPPPITPRWKDGKPPDKV